MTVNEFETYPSNRTGSPAQQYQQRQAELAKQQDARNYNQAGGAHGTQKVPTFSERNEIGPVTSNSLSAKMNTQKLKQVEESKYDAPQNGGKRRRRKSRRRKSRRRRRRKSRRRRRK